MYLSRRATRTDHHALTTAQPEHSWTCLHHVRRRGSSLHVTVTSRCGLLHLSFFLLSSFMLDFVFVFVSLPYFIIQRRCDSTQLATVTCSTRSTRPHLLIEKKTSAPQDTAHLIERTHATARSLYSSETQRSSSRLFDHTLGQLGLSSPPEDNMSRYDLAIRVGRNSGCVLSPTHLTCKVRPTGEAPLTLSSLSTGAWSSPLTSARRLRISWATGGVVLSKCPSFHSSSPCAAAPSMCRERLVGPSQAATHLAAAELHQWISCRSWRPQCESQCLSCGTEPQTSPNFPACCMTPWRFPRPTSCLHCKALIVLKQHDSTATLERFGCLWLLVDLVVAPGRPYTSPPVPPDPVRSVNILLGRSRSTPARFHDRYWRSQTFLSQEIFPPLGSDDSCIFFFDNLHDVRRDLGV